jgi:hypothetical protein
MGVDAWGDATMSCAMPRSIPISELGSSIDVILQQVSEIHPEESNLI